MHMRVQARAARTRENLNAAILSRYQATQIPRTGVESSNEDEESQYDKAIGEGWRRGEGFQIIRAGVGLKHFARESQGNCEMKYSFDVIDGHFDERESYETKQNESLEKGRRKPERQSDRLSGPLSSSSLNSTWRRVTDLDLARSDLKCTLESQTAPRSALRLRSASVCGGSKADATEAGLLVVGRYDPMQVREAPVDFARLFDAGNGSIVDLTRLRGLRTLRGALATYYELIHLWPPRISNTRGVTYTRIRE
ncbi:hypothetical protein C8J57DRAFT_1477898 [Mycena rebaudengoi]|nr:hypothetical protein C8J57DRAFT_1477898 [Mycena rebaudengoi]